MPKDEPTATDELGFLQFLQAFRRGELLAEADERLTDLLDAIARHGGKGELTLKLPFKVNDAGQLECVPVVTSKKPVRRLGTGIFFITPEGRLTRRDPAQMDMLDELDERRRRPDAG